MSASFEFAWRDDGILMVRRTGLMTLQDADDYLDATRRAHQDAPQVWGIVVDVRDAPPQTDAVQAKIQDVVQFHVAAGVRRVAIVGKSVVTQMQQKRITTGPGLHAQDKIGFYTDLDEAISDVKAALV